MSKIHKTHIGKYLDYDIYKVDGHALRNISKDFGVFFDWDTHYQLKDIPKNEIWISNNIDTEEQFVNMATAFCFCKSIEQGMSSKRAFSKCSKMDKKIRKRIFHTSKSHKKIEVIDSIYKKLYKTLENKIEVWIVDGEKVRNLYDENYIEGGHGYVYNYVPKDEIWLDSGLLDDELIPVLVHEYIEMKLMKEKHMQYPKAHIFATKAEYKIRDKV